MAVSFCRSWAGCVIAIQTRRERDPTGGMIGLDIGIARFFTLSDADDPSNLTNRPPYPTLHLIREASLAKAVESFPNPEAIFESNIEVVNALGGDSGGGAPKVGLEWGFELLEYTPKSLLS